MARSHDDTWDITEGVGATALGVAMGRAGEAHVEHPLFSDPYAQVFLDAAREAGWQPFYTPELMAELVEAAPRVQARMTAMSNYTASRTKFFDDFFIDAAHAGIRQAVILAAGLDARAWRLPWAAGTVVYEIDQPKVLEFKATTLDEHGAQLAAGYAAVPIDLREDWPQALRQSGFDPSVPTAWTAEGLLPYLPAEGETLLFERILDLSAPGSRVAAEAFGADFFDRAAHDRANADIQELRDAVVKAGGQVPTSDDLWFMEDRPDLADWLTKRGWDVTAIAATDLMAGYGRPAPENSADTTLKTTFVQARSYSSDS